MQTQTPPQLPVLQGGFRTIVSDLLTKVSLQIHLALFVLLLLGIVFVEQIPLGIREALSTTIGRLFLFGGVLFITELYSWTTGLLVALFVLLLITKSSRNLKEGFTSDDFSIKLIEDKKKWWVEEVLNENPIGIMDDRVNTLAVQDKDEEMESKNTSVQDSRGQNSSIM
jgi:hypothetical protein